MYINSHDNIIRHKKSSLTEVNWHFIHLFNGRDFLNIYNFEKKFTFGLLELQVKDLKKYSNLQFYQYFGFLYFLMNLAPLFFCVWLCGYISVSPHVNNSKSLYIQTLDLFVTSNYSLIHVYILYEYYYYRVWVTMQSEQGWSCVLTCICKCAMMFLRLN